MTPSELGRLDDCLRAGMIRFANGMIRMSSCGTDGCPDEIRYARHGHEFHGVKMNRMIPAGFHGC